MSITPLNAGGAGLSAGVSTATAMAATAATATVLAPGLPPIPRLDPTRLPPNVDYSSLAAGCAAAISGSGNGGNGSNGGNGGNGGNSNNSGSVLAIGVLRVLAEACATHAASMGGGCFAPTVAMCRNRRSAA
jgi:hypothetical protein